MSVMPPSIRALLSSCGTGSTSVRCTTCCNSACAQASLKRWSVRDPELFIFQIKNPEDTIREVAESSMRATVANFDLVQAIGPGRVEIEAQVQRLEDEGQILLEGRSSQGKTLLLAADLSGGLIRISLIDPTQDGRPMLTDALARRCSMRQL